MPDRPPKLRESALYSATVLIVSYHFYPASEIGARRVTALARYLADRGVRVVVVSAFGNRAVARGSEIQPGIIAIPVPRPQRPWLDLLVALKRRLVSRRNAAADSASPGGDTSGTPSEWPAASFRAR